MGWDSVGKGGAADFVQLEAGKPVKVHIVLLDGQEPESYFTHFINEANGGKGASVVCPGAENGCPCCANKKVYPRRVRHAVNVVDPISGEVKILESGNTIFKAIKAAFDEYGDLDTVDFKISKTGAGLDTEYAVLPVATKFTGDKTDLELKDLTELATPTDVETIQMLMDGGSFGDETPAPEAPAKGKAKGKPAPAPEPEEEPAEEDVPPAKAGKKAPPVDPDEEPTEEATAGPTVSAKQKMQKINTNFVTLDRYSNPANIRADMVAASKTKANPKGKATLTQFSAPELDKLLAMQAELE